MRLCILPLMLLLLRLQFESGGVDGYERADFPADFIFGSGTFAFQYEGGAFEDGRTPSVWDTFAHSGHSGGAIGDVACDGYHKYKGDVALMALTGLDAYKFSISWSRLIPNGRGALNPKGLQYYNDLIDELVKHGIQPHITLTHMDIPQVLEDEYDGWLSRDIVEDFVGYADACFREFGDRVSHWTTINEGNSAALGGYGEGKYPPGRCSDKGKCPQGNSSTEPYLVVHNMLLAHSAAAKLYRDVYKATQNGLVGINVYARGFDPLTNSTEDKLATQRAMDFHLGWVVDPLVFGDYPDIVKKRAKTRIPTFTKAESEQLKGSADFFGLNHYYTSYIKDNPNMENDVVDFYTDMAVDTIVVPDAGDGGFVPMPWGLIEVLQYFKDHYGNPTVYIHENGQKSKRDGNLNDTSRVKYLQAFVGAVLDSVRNGSNTKAYFVWTLFDCLELLDGYKTGYGIFYVDLDDEKLTRYAKSSAHWYSDFLGKDASFSQAIADT